MQNYAVIVPSQFNVVVFALNRSLINAQTEPVIPLNLTVIKSLTIIPKNKTNDKCFFKSLIINSIYNTTQSYD